MQVGPFGHSDFYGADEFDFTLEDNDPKTSPWPWGAPQNHFQEKEESQRQVNDAIEKCSWEEFSCAMHRLQDFESHRGKGFEWDPVTIIYSPRFETAVCDAGAWLK